jgi:hypothetical protein
VAEFDLFLAAQKLFALFIEQMEVQGIDLPERQCICPGNEIVFDCEQVTLHLTRILGNKEGADTPAPGPHALLIASAELYFTIVRCVPVAVDNGSNGYAPPDPADVTAATGVLMRDARAMRRALEYIEQQHLFVPRNVPVTIGPVQTIGPTGDMAAVAGLYAFQMVDQDWDWDSDEPLPLGVQDDR